MTHQTRSPSNPVRLTTSPSQYLGGDVLVPKGVAVATRPGVTLIPATAAQPPTGATVNPTQPTPAPAPNPGGDVLAPRGVSVAARPDVILIRATAAQPPTPTPGRSLQTVQKKGDTLDPSLVGHILGHGEAPIFEKPTGYFTVKLTVPLKVTRIFGGTAPKAGSIFLHEPPPTAATSDEAKTYLGSAREPGNTATLKAYATIPAGTIVLIGLSAPGITPGPGPTLFGGKIVVELANPADAKRVRFSNDFHLPDNPGFPFGDGPDQDYEPVGPH